MQFLKARLLDMGFPTDLASPLAEGVAVLLLLILGVIAFQLTKRAILKRIEHFVLNNKYSFDNRLMEAKVFSRSAQYVPAVIIHLGAALLPTYGGVVQRVTTLYMIALTVYVADALLNAAERIYQTQRMAKARPIKGYLQVVKILVFVFAAIAFFSNLMGKSPVYLLSGLGAMTAVLMLVFKDSILGLVAGVQLAVNDMVRIGDWIEMPGYSADGTVIDISLHTVKVENFDRTITTLPTYALISASFRNWRAMAESGGRRIKRSLLIDINSVSFLDDAMLKSLESIRCLQPYLVQQSEDLCQYNAPFPKDEWLAVNGRQQTNIGVFRAYVQRYLEDHPQIVKDAIIMARQLPPSETGLPIEVYCFANTTVWGEYEGIQADLFDHFLAVLPRFGLRIYQQPSGADFERFK